MIDLAKADRNNALTHLKLGLPLAPPRRSRRAGALRRRRVRVPVGHRPAADLALRLVRDGPGRVRRRRLAGVLRHRPQDHAGQGRPHPLGDGVRQVGRGGPELRPRAGRALQYRAAPAGQHQARRGARRAPPRGADARRRAIPQVLLARGRVEREVGDGDSALAAFHGYLRAWRRAGASASSRSPARCSCSAGSTACSRTTRARRPTTPATVAGYRADLATIASDSVLNEFDQQHRRAAGGLSASGSGATGTGPSSAGRRRTAPRALPAPVLRPQELPAHLAQPALRHRRALPLGQPRLRRPRRHLHPPRRAQQPRHLRRARARAQRVVAVHPARRRSDLPLRRAGGRAGLQAGREPVRRARLQPGGRAARRPSAERQPGGRAADAVARAARRRSTSRLQAAGAVGTGQYQTEERRMGQTSIALGTTTDSYELRFADELKVALATCSRSDGTRPGTQVQIAYAIAGPGPRAGDGDPRLPLLASGSASSAMDRTGPGRGVARYHPPFRRARRRCRTASTWWAGSPCRCPPGSSSTAWPFSRARRPAWSCRATTRAGGRPDLGRAGAQRPGARHPHHQPDWRRTDAGYRPVQSAPDVQARATRWSSTTRSRACARQAVRGAAGGEEAGRRAAGCSRRSSAAAGRPSASSSTHRPRPPVEPTHRESRARPAEAGQLRAGADGGRTREGRKDQRTAGLPGGDEE